MDPETGQLAFPLYVGHESRVNEASHAIHWLRRGIMLTCISLPCAASRAQRFLRMPEHIKKKLQEEIDLLEHELNHELPAELKKAVAMGDLSENAEYHMAKQRQE